MVKNYKMVLEYDGSRYNGWQKQGNTKDTIQGKIEMILSRYLGQEIEVHGSGRTDAGVHAKGQVVNFKFKDDGNFQKPDRLMKEINMYLPDDIRILSVEEADGRFHARLNARQKTYRYVLCLDRKKSVFARKYCVQVDPGIDLGLMKAAASRFLGEHDFTGFCDSKTNKSMVRRIDSISFLSEEMDGETYLYIDFTGDGFLYHMVRLMTGTLIAIGEGRAEGKIISEILKTNERKHVPQMAPAEGLFLMEVLY